MKKLLLRYNPLVYLLFTLLGFLVFTSCDKDDENIQSVKKELLATASSQTTVADGGTVKFIDLSLGVKNRLWTFPGGTPATSDKPEIEVVFSEEGDVIATLEIEYVDGSKESMEFPIKVFPVLIADFSPSATRIKVGESVTFTDTSVGVPTSWSWEFEGGTPATSTEQNPTVQFNVNNPTTIKLTITRAEDGSSSEVEKVIQVGPPELCLNGDFETGTVVDWQTWNGSPFPYTAQAGGANGTNYTSIVNFEGVWGWGQIISRDFPNNKIAIENGKDYTLSMYVKADAPIRLDTFRGVNHLPTWSAAFPAGGTEEGYSEYYPISGTSLPYAITTSWTKVSIVIRIPDDGNTRTNFFPDIILGGAVNSKVYIDEISVKIVE
ncbi:PKD domain-containing protein [Gaetbulibacter aquiaggeris]|uniref:PKD domain-containing protein n=1 Tax=Gaetbulibacter aquiaggeris TaxID=1735373 RepID=A0ABW7MPR8_9FLAO